MLTLIGCCLIPTNGQSLKPCSSDRGSRMIHCATTYVNLSFRNLEKKIGKRKVWYFGYCKLLLRKQQQQQQSKAKQKPNKQTNKTKKCTVNLRFQFCPEYLVQSHYNPTDTPSIGHRNGNPNMHGMAAISFDSEGSSSPPSSLAQIMCLCLGNSRHTGWSWLQYNLLKRWPFCVLHKGVLDKYNIYLFISNSIENCR